MAICGKKATQPKISLWIDMYSLRSQVQAALTLLKCSISSPPIFLKKRKALLKFSNVVIVTSDCVVLQQGQQKK